MSDRDGHSPDITREFLLVKAVEEADEAGALIPLDARDVREGEGSHPGALLARGRRLFQVLEAREPEAVRGAMRVTSHHAWLKVALVVAALLLGLATKQLGPERRVNLLAFPLIGVLAWNVLVFVAIAAGAMLGGRAGAPAGAGLLRGAVARWSDRALRAVGAGDKPSLAAGLKRFVAEWLRVTAAARVARLRATLHLAAAALSVGVIFGMYWNGLAFSYLAAWESTFLNAEQVHHFFHALFAPAAALSGIAPPTLDEVRAIELRSGDEGMSAANWIHLFAITVGLFVVVPRLVLAAVSASRARRLERAIDFRELAPRYIERLMRSTEGGNLVARIVAHRMELGSRDRDRLRAFAHDLWGGQLWVEFGDPVAYGDEEEAEFEPADYQLLVLNFSSTPEDESQGRLVKRFREQLGGAGLVVLEVAPFRERFGGLGEFERRLSERRAAWESVLGRAGVSFVMFDSEGAGADVREAALAAVIGGRDDA